MSILFTNSTDRCVHEDVDERVPEDGGLGHLQREHSDQQRDGGAVPQDTCHQASIFCSKRETKGMSLILSCPHAKCVSLMPARERTA